VELEPLKCAECGAKVSPKDGEDQVRCAKCGAVLEAKTPSETPKRKKKRARAASPQLSTEASAAKVASPGKAEASTDDAGRDSDAEVEPAAPGGATAFRVTRMRGGGPFSGLLQGVFIVLAAVAVFGFVRAAKNDQAHAACTAVCAMNPAYAGRNRRAPDFTLPDLDGKSVSLSSFRGRTVVLNFWSSTCGPCRDEMPSLAKLGLILKDHPEIALVTVTVDDDPQVVKDTLQVLFATDPEAKEAINGGPIPFPVLFDPELKVGRDLYGTTMYPETWIIDPQGYIRMRYDGPFDWSNPLAMNAIQSPGKGTGCIASIDLGKPVGPNASLCDSE